MDKINGREAVWLVLFCTMLSGCGNTGVTPGTGSGNRSGINSVTPERDMQKPVNSIREMPVSEKYPVSSSFSLPVAEPKEVSGEMERMERCKRELDALRRINGELYSKRKTEFDRLISGASVYNSVRGNVGAYTRNTVDALYRYRADKLCADIASDVLQGLTK